MKQQRTTEFKIKSNNRFLSDRAAAAFGVLCGIIWLLSLMEVCCGSIRKVISATEPGEVLNLFLSRRTAYLPVIHEVYRANGGMMLLALAGLLAAAFAAICFWLAMMRGRGATFAAFMVFAAPLFALQIWMPDSDLHMTEVYLALTGGICFMEIFGKNRRRGIAVLCGLVLLSTAVFQIAGTAGAESRIASFRESIDAKIEASLYGGRESGMTFGRFDGDEPEERTDNAALEITMSTPQALYLRGYTADVYTEEGWKPATEFYGQNPVQEEEDNGLFYRLAEENFDSTTMLAAAVKAAGMDIEQTESNIIQVANKGASGKYLYLPYEAQTIEAKGKTLIGGGIRPDKAGGRRYSVTALPYCTDRYGEVIEGLRKVSGKSGSADSTEAYRQAESNYRNYVLQYDLLIPDQCKEAISAFFAEQEDIQTTGEAKSEILKKLSSLKYDESVTYSAAKGDFIKQFLERKSGYDKHFAAAAVMAFRYYGIPARFTEGYLVTEEMAQAAEPGEKIAVTAAQAHCWAEYYEEGVGWLPFETTPTYIGLMKSAGSVEIEPDRSEEPQTEKSNVQEENEQQMVTTETDANYMMLIFLMIILLLIVLAAVWLARKKRKARSRKLADIPKKRDMKNADRKKAVIALMYFIRKREKRHGPADGERAKIEEIYMEARYSMHEISEEKYQRVLNFYNSMGKRRKAAGRASGIKAVLCLLLACSIIFTGCKTQTDNPYEAGMKKVQAYLSVVVTDPVSGSVGGEWAVIALTRGGSQVDDSFLDRYIENTEKTVQEAKGVLNTPTGYKYTEYSRVILGWTAAGKDPTDVEGYNFLEKLTDMEKVCRQGINGPIWALIAYDSGGYEIPQNAGAKNPTSREALLKYILKSQTSDGGWTLSGDEADVDLTAMALTAMAPYVNGDEELCAEVTEEILTEVAAAAEKAVSCLAAKKLPEGGFESWGSENAESCAQVITALSALGIDVETDKRFEGTPEALLAFQQEDGGFAHTPDGQTNQMATEQAAYALAAYDRMQKGGTSLFDMR